MSGYNVQQGSINKKLTYTCSYRSKQIQTPSSKQRLTVGALSKWSAITSGRSLSLMLKIPQKRSCLKLL